MASDSDSASANYLDFDLEIGLGTGREYPVAVVHSPAGETRATMRFPFDNLALASRLKDLQIALLRSGGKRRQVLTPEESAVQDFGKQLFDALITAEVRSRYDVSHREATTRGKGLRLKLRIAAPELAALPWEFLYDSRQAEYVCLSTNTPVVRYLELPQPIQPLEVTPPLRVLGMIVSPRDLPELDVTREKQRVENALKDLQARGLVEVTWLAGQAWRDLQRAMRSSTWHIFHFIGHGGFDRIADEGVIALADDEGKAAHLNATQLGRLLADHRSLRLVLLNSCEGARGSERDLFSSTASILVRRGIPAVLAMQYEITDHAAIEFSRAFYEAIADGLPVDAATAEARKAVSMAVANTIEWGTPVLFMRAPDGMLFRLQVQFDAEHRAQELARLEHERKEREAREQAAREKTERQAREKAMRKQATKQITDLVAQLTQAESKSDWDKVIELGERILKLDANRQPTRSKTANACWERGAIYHNKSDYDRAIADCTRAIELNLDKAVYYASRGTSYHNKGDYDRAIADYTRAIELDPNKADYNRNRGNSFHEKHDYDRAINDKSRAIEMDPNKADYYNSRGISYEQKGDYDHAIVDYTHAIELDPQNAHHYYERGVSYHNAKVDRHAIGDYDRAIADLSRAIELDADNPDYYYSRGTSYKLKGDRPSALLDFQRAAEMGHANAKNELAKEVVERQEAEHQIGEQTSKQIIDFLPQFAEAELRRDWNKVIELGELILKLDSNHQPTRSKTARAFMERGMFLSRVREYDRAIEAKNRAIELDPNNASYFYARGINYEWLSNHDLAIKDFNRAVELKPDETDYYFERGKSYYGKHDYESAIADFSRAIALKRKVPNFFYARGLSYKMKGNQNAARRDFQRAAEMGHTDAKKELAKL